MQRNDGRKPDELRKVKVTKNYIKYAEGSCLIEFGNTKIITTASVEQGVPSFMRGKGLGWVTAEYSMIPRSCRSRVPREASKGRLGGRTQEIQRLVGRSMRSIVNMRKLGERTIWMDCDVIQADGSTRCASITGSFISLALALEKIRKDKLIDSIPLADHVAAVSVGIVNGVRMLDLDYDEDSNSEVDMNIIMTGGGKFIELQGTAERKPFAKSDMDHMAELAHKGVNELVALQKKVLKGII